jgi:membrane protease YdiL (CAAX protease family)
LSGDGAAAARRKVQLYLGLLVVFCVPSYGAIIAAGQLRAYGRLAILALTWAPALACLVTRFVYQKNVRGVGWGIGKPRFLAIAYALPVAVALPVYAFVWLTGLGGFAPDQLPAATSAQLAGDFTSPAAALAFLMTASIPFTGLFALGEEIGWRGLLVPELMKFNGFTRTALISAVIWTVYHVPAILFADYHSVAPAWWAVGCFTAMVFGISFVINWARLASGSVWPAVMLHASHNVFVQGIFDVVTVDRGSTQYITTEFGCGLAITYAVLAWLVWRRRAELPSGETT